jgi:hypothetical protein
MSTQVIGARRGVRMGTTLVAAALALVVAILAMQGTSLWSARAGSGAGRDKARVAPAASQRIVDTLPAFSRPGAHRARVKYGPSPRRGPAPRRPHQRGRVKWEKWDS